MKTESLYINFFLKVRFIFSLLLNTNLSFGKISYYGNVNTVRAWEALVLHRLIRKDVVTLTSGVVPNKVDLTAVKVIWFNDGGQWKVLTMYPDIP